jgi:hypothetical protein
MQCANLERLPSRDTATHRLRLTSPIRPTSLTGPTSLANLGFAPPEPPEFLTITLVLAEGYGWFLKRCSLTDRGDSVIGSGGLTYRQDVATLDDMYDVRME